MHRMLECDSSCHTKSLWADSSRLPAENYEPLCQVTKVSPKWPSIPSTTPSTSSLPFHLFPALASLDMWHLALSPPLVCTSRYRLRANPLRYFLYALEIYSIFLLPPQVMKPKKNHYHYLQWCFGFASRWLRCFSYHQIHYLSIYLLASTPAFPFIWREVLEKSTTRRFLIILNLFHSKSIYMRNSPSVNHSLPFRGVYHLRKKPASTLHRPTSLLWIFHLCS